MHSLQHYTFLFAAASLATFTCAIPIPVEGATLTPASVTSDPPTHIFGDVGQLEKLTSAVKLLNGNGKAARRQTGSPALIPPPPAPPVPATNDLSGLLGNAVKSVPGLLGRTDNTKRQVAPAAGPKSPPVAPATQSLSSLLNKVVPVIALGNREDIFVSDSGIEASTADSTTMNIVYVNEDGDDDSDDDSDDDDDDDEGDDDSDGSEDARRSLGTYTTPTTSEYVNIIEVNEDDDDDDSDNSEDDDEGDDDSDGSEDARRSLDTYITPATPEYVNIVEVNENDDDNDSDSSEDARRSLQKRGEDAQLDSAAPPWKRLSKRNKDEDCDGCNGDRPTSFPVLIADATARIGKVSKKLHRSLTTHATVDTYIATALVEEMKAVLTTAVDDCTYISQNSNNATFVFEGKVMEVRAMAGLLARLIITIVTTLVSLQQIILAVAAQNPGGLTQGIADIGGLLASLVGLAVKLVPGLIGVLSPLLSAVVPLIQLLGYTDVLKALGM